MQHPENFSSVAIMAQRDYRATAILAGLVANPECTRVDVQLLVEQAVRLAEALGARLVETAPANRYAGS